MLRLYLDENCMDAALVQALEDRGVVVTTVSNAGAIGWSDEEQLEYAAAHDHVLVTKNVRDFYRIHTEWLTQGKAHAGIIFIRHQQFSIGEEARRMIRLARAKSVGAMRSQIEFLSVW